MLFYLSEGLVEDSLYALAAGFAGQILEPGGEGGDALLEVVEVEFDGVAVGLIGEEDAQGRHYYGAYPHAVGDVPRTVARHLHA